MTSVSTMIGCEQGDSTDSHTSRMVRVARADHMGGRKPMFRFRVCSNIASPLLYMRK
jgi:hypothetical protein